MVETSTRLLRPLRSALLAAALLAGCTPPAPPPSAPAPVPPLSAAELETVARLLQAEDRRDFAEPLLREATASPAPGVRRRAALAMGRLRRPEGAPFLIGLLNDADSSVAATAAFSLGLLGDSAHVAALTPLVSATMTAARPTVAAEAAHALGRVGSDSAGEALLDFLEAAPEAPSAPAEAALLAVWRFRRPPDLEPIVRWTRSADSELRWRAAYALTRRSAPAATPALLRLATDADARVRALALRGLTAPLADSSGLGAASVLPAVLAAVRDGDYSVRVNAIRSLGTFPDPAAVARLVTVLDDGADLHASLAAAEALGRLGAAAASAAPALGSLALGDSVPLAIRGEALGALARVSPAAGTDVAERLALSPWWRLRAAAARALAVSGADSSVLARLLRDPDGRVASAALQAARHAAGDGVARLRGRLVEALGSDDVQVRATALGGLAELADPSLLPLLLDAYQIALADSLNDAALAAVDAIAAAGGRGSAPQRAFFARFGRSPDHLVRLRARERFGAPADAAWGEPLPIDPGRTLAHYLAVAERWIAPPPGQAMDPEVEIETAGAGAVRLRLFAADAPLTVESFLSLAARGYFDGQEWPRVVPNFVVQGGDPRGDTGGGPGYSLRDEINRHRYLEGSVGMALAGADTGGSQFFVTHSPQPHLDGDYTVFGEVLGGKDVNRSILPGDTIRSIRIVR